MVLGFVVMTLVKLWLSRLEDYLSTVPG